MIEKLSGIDARIYEEKGKKHFLSGCNVLATYIEAKKELVIYPLYDYSTTTLKHFFAIAEHLGLDIDEARIKSNSVKGLTITKAEALA